MTAVKEIERFDQEEFYVKTSQGNLLIRGEELKVVHLDVDKGLLTLEGNVKLLQ
ncbi:YabP/YqfC family sporulation protein [Ureibacillus acetophenoni]